MAFIYMTGFMTGFKGMLMKSTGFMKGMFMKSTGCVADINGEGVGGGEAKNAKSTSFRRRSVSPFPSPPFYACYEG